MAVRMSRKTWIILAIVIVAVGATVGIALSRNSPTPSDITLPIITWNETTLSELEGTPVVLNFWSISCPYCRLQLPYLENVAQQVNGEIEVIAVNLVDSASRIQTFFGEYEPAMTIALDKNGQAFVGYCMAYNNTKGSIPFTLFIDSEGMVQYAKIGAFASEAALWSTLHDVLGIATP
jgi:cytochrome c biogenesis protein CcmG/thiol:disulfide interchange protein DsbE